MDIVIIQTVGAPIKMLRALTVYFHCHDGEGKAHHWTKGLMTHTWYNGFAYALYIKFWVLWRTWTVTVNFPCFRFRLKRLKYVYMSSSLSGRCLINSGFHSMMPTTRSVVLEGASTPPWAVTSLNSTRRLNTCGIYPYDSCTGCNLFLDFRPANHSCTYTNFKTFFQRKSFPLYLSALDYRNTVYDAACNTQVNSACQSWGKLINTGPSFKCVPNEKQLPPPPRTIMPCESSQQTLRWLWSIKGIEGAVHDWKQTEQQHNKQQQ